MSEFTEVLINLRKIVRSVNLESKRIQKEFGVSIPQLLCLHYLATKPCFQSTMTGIAAYMNLNLSSVTGIVSRLEKKHLLAKLPKSGDKRITIVSLTASGMKLIDKSPELMHQQLSNKLSALSDDQIASLKESLQLLVQSFDLSEETASPLITMDDFSI
ncbi:MAG: MarR family transcriptional regulator [Bacteroidetes bacterium]|nr:MarR family transcriptional regulator [Bacteroidota bacterium]MBU2558149.1 MarR family transcriptional regulator [Bacteroidota bacterium]